MSTVATIPTIEQSCAFAALIRRGELTTEYARLIDAVALVAAQ